ncbi:flippase [Natronomonas sp. F2-12]|uniref:Flippase n=1 Tax=Natronomonas aquatica TaxID=2841590 RepID=A0A9R1CSY3_9EURY|nr:flippase [Natronomonas aquatica]MCQ4333114.1 flippase [Natronomonas aquatica]
MAQFSDLLTRVKGELLGQILTTFLGAALIFLLARLLGPERYGLLFLTISILGFMRVFSEAGVANSGARYIAEYKECDPDQIPHILRISFGYNLVTIVTVVAVLVGSRHYLAGLFGESELAVLLLYGVFFVIFGTLVRYVRIVLQGFEKIELSATIHVLTILCRFVFAIGLVLLGYGVWGAFVGYIISFILVSMLGLGLVYVRFYRAVEADATVAHTLRRRIAEYTVPLTATNTARAIDLHIDTILVGFFLTPVSVGFYVLAKQITQFLETPAYAVGFSLAPTFGAEKARENVQRSAQMYETSLVYSLLVYLPASVGVVLVSEPAIQYVFGTAYLGAVPVLQVLALYVVFRSMTTITENSLDYLGRARSRAIIKLPTVGLNIVLNVLLIPRLGVVGAALATVVSYGLFTMATMYVIHTELGLRIRYLGRQVTSILAITVIMAIGVAFGLQFVSGLFSLLLVVLSGAIIWGISAVFSGIFDLNKFDIYQS